MNNKLKNELKHKWTFNYRVTIMNDDTMDEKYSTHLNRLNIFVLFASMSILLVAGTVFIIFATPLKQYIPGYNSNGLRKSATTLMLRSDSLEKVIENNQLYVDNLFKVLNGEVDSSDIEDFYSRSVDSIMQNKLDVDFSASKEDSLFRIEIESKNRYSVFDKNKNENFVLAPPISGSISYGYEKKNKHYAIDIAAAVGTPVKSVADGTVIFSEWTSTTGNVVVIMHNDNLISVYKHNTSANVEQGDVVTSGEVIASSGSTGELSTGPHLHFELWQDGYPLNPIDYIDFE
ncbi:MAG: M23 family metallopeptidase [Ichthyobacteriaceae bacterium]|nr:M23 family metallopeptidase [Ichthyobacteriaceae bacterium]